MTENIKLEMDFSQEQLDDMLRIHGCFAIALRRVQHHIKRYGYTVFAPLVPDTVSKDDLRTIIDISVSAGFKTVVIPKCPYHKSLERRGAVHSAGVLSVIC